MFDVHPNSLSLTEFGINLNLAQQSLIALIEAFKVTKVNVHIVSKYAV